MSGKEQVRIGIILLAAGEASRMGMPKQLLVYRKRTLIRHVIDELLLAELPLVVILGARATMIEPVISDLPVSVAVNKHWSKGMGTSLKLGLETITKLHPSLQAVLCCVVDQPFLSRELVREFIHLFREMDDPTSALIAARYQNAVVGVPALFGARYFSSIAALSDNAGARYILKAESNKLIEIDFPAGDFDLDSPEDWKKFNL